MGRANLHPFVLYTPQHRFLCQLSTGYLCESATLSLCNKMLNLSQNSSPTLQLYQYADSLRDIKDELMALMVHLGECSYTGIGLYSQSFLVQDYV